MLKSTIAKGAASNPHNPNEVCDLDQILKSNYTSSKELETADPERLQLYRKHLNGLKNLLAEGISFKKINGLEIEKLAPLIANPQMLQPLKQFGFHFDDILAIPKEQLTIYYQFYHQLSHLKASGFGKEELRRMSSDTLKLVFSELRRTQRVLNAGLSKEQLITMNPNSLNVFLKNAYDLAHLSLSQEQLSELVTLDADHLEPLLSRSSAFKLLLNHRASFEQMRSANKSVLTHCVQHVDKVIKALTLISMKQILGVAQIPSLTPQVTLALDSSTNYSLEEIRKIPGINSRKAEALCEHRAQVEQFLKRRVDLYDLAQVEEERLVSVLTNLDAVDAALHFVSVFELLGVPEKTQYSPRQFKPEPVRNLVASNQATATEKDASRCVIQ